MAITQTATCKRYVTYHVHVLTNINNNILYTPTVYTYIHKIVMYMATHPNTSTCHHISELDNQIKISTLSRRTWHLMWQSFTSPSTLCSAASKVEMTVWRLVRVYEEAPQRRACFKSTLGCGENTKIASFVSIQIFI